MFLENSFFNLDILYDFQTKLDFFDPVKVATLFVNWLSERNVLRYVIHVAHQE